MKRILHITAHMGGGVGNAISNLTCGLSELSSRYENTIMLLEKSIRSQYINKCKERGINFIYSDEILNLLEFMEQFDIVVFNWWHHPLLFKLLVSIDSIKIRSILWIHISGNGYPKLCENHFSIFSHVFFTSRASIDLYKDLSKVDSDNKEFSDLNLLYGLGDYSKFLEVQPSYHEGFRIGYVGTINYTKMHPDYVQFCREAWEEGTEYWLAGEGEIIETVNRDFVRVGMVNTLKYQGYCFDVANFLSQIDVLGYLLNPSHYGTTENVIIEAMAAGVPVIAMNQSVEKYIITHMETGILVDNPEAYKRAVVLLKENPLLKTKIVESARREVEEKYSLRKNAELFLNVVENVMHKEKSCFDTIHTFGVNAYEWFLSGLGISNITELTGNQNLNIGLERLKSKVNLQLEILEYPEILVYESKGSVKHFRKYFYSDVILNFFYEDILETYRRRGVHV